VRPTTTLLIRHAHTDAIGHRLCGRLPGVQLSAAGRAQAEALGAALAPRTLAAIYTSPLERAVATAHAIARCQPVPITVCEELGEIDFGEWTGKTFAELAPDTAWRAFNTRRATADVPGGERAADAQARIVAALSGLSARHAGETIAIVSHGDVLRFAVLHYASTPLDLYDRFQIDPASVTAVSLSADGPRLLYVNNRTLSGDA
jgi:probable phosphoglycerate mutase